MEMASTHMDGMYDGDFDISLKLLPHKAVEEEVLDDMVQDFSTHGRKQRGQYCS